MVIAKLIEVNGPVRLIQRIRAVSATIVRQSRCYRDARAGEKQCLARTIPHILTKLIRESGWRYA